MSSDLGARGSRYNDVAMLLAGDIGGTKTLLGLFRPAPEERPPVVEVGEFVTLAYDGLEPMIREFLDARRIDPRTISATCLGVAGAVTDQVARMTNVPWRVDGAAIGELGLRRVRVINDLEALAYGVMVLEPDELATLQRGVPSPHGNAAVLAAGTGLGEALLHNVDGRFVPSASEGGHADFAARTPREMEMVRELTRVFGRVSVEHVISGIGLVNVYQFTHQSFGTGPMLTPSSIAPARLCQGVGAVREPSELPARITSAAMEGRCAQCSEALDLFVSAYGAEAGNIGLRGMATAGVYVGGGIAPKILPALKARGFLEAFRAKEPMADLVATMPVAVILNPDAGLLGAAVHAQHLSRTA